MLRAGRPLPTVCTELGDSVPLSGTTHDVYHVCDL
ncbi:hypothetical protein Rrhod_1442 [Rhodococcus rhodnii LMG 5362]|uniref:Uncharacterized protein n=1 Tax=Rhodococcus rhodnii LMG 5362 TaxID=1273125 RepID=R7WSQ5_9NOCA|nr:hypothetical protein Rrhod_1442 [Rhodococcus rhodnii LMG 5362]